MQKDLCQQAPNSVPKAPLAALESALCNTFVIHNLFAMISVCNQLPHIIITTLYNEQDHHVFSSIELTVEPHGWIEKPQFNEPLLEFDFFLLPCHHFAYTIPPGLPVSFPNILPEIDWNDCKLCGEEQM